MCRIFSDLPGVAIVVDDILVHGRDATEHDFRLCKVLQQCCYVNLKLNASKSMIGCSEVDYVGHRLTADGLLPMHDRMKSIMDLQDPTDHSERATFFTYGYICIKIHSKFICINRTAATGAKVRGVVLVKIGIRCCESN